MHDTSELTAKINLLLAMNSVSDAELARRDQMLSELRGLLTEKDGLLAEKDKKIIDLTNEVIGLRASRIWRFTAPLRATTNFLRQFHGGGFRS